MAGFFDGVESILTTVAPTIASLIGGPLAGTATSLVINALGLAPTATSADVATALKTATPEQIAALKKVDDDFKVQMKTLDIHLVDDAYADTANARARQVATKDYTPAIMGYTILVGSLAASVLVLMGKVPDTSLQAGVVIGYLFSEAKAVLGYYFGSSAGSDKKTDLMSTMTSNSAPAKADPQ